MRDLTKRLNRMWKQNKSPHFSTMSKDLYRDYGYDVHEESLRKAHRGDVDPTQCSVELLLGLKAYYGVESSALGEVAARRIATTRALVGVDGPEIRPHRHSSGSSGWLRETAGHAA